MHTGEELAGIRILVVEDDGDLRTLFEIVFRRCGATDVRAADSARRALELLDESHPDVLVSDIGMPGEDGYWLIDQVRRRPPSRGGNVPAVAVTAYTQRYERERTLECGFQAYLPKPILPDELCRVTAGLARGGPAAAH